MTMLTQSLEPRVHLSVQITDTGVTISGTDNADTITVVTLPDKLRVTVNGERSYVPVEVGQILYIKVNGGDGHDAIRLRGATHQFIAHGGGGNDTISADGGDDDIFGDDGADRINSRGGNDEIEGGPGDDHIVGGEGDDQIVGKAGNDTIRGQGGNDSIGGDGDTQGPSAGGPGTDDDVLVGGDGDDRINGFAGDDLIHGNAGNDVLNGFFGGGIMAYVDGTDGNDRIWGGDGDDIIEGGWGNDTLVGGNGRDELRETIGIYGGEGNDTMIASDDDNAPDTVDGGTGDDRARLKKGIDVVTNVEKLLFA